MLEFILISLLAVFAWSSYVLYRTNNQSKLKGKICHEDRIIVVNYLSLFGLLHPILGFWQTIIMAVVIVVSFLNACSWGTTYSKNSMYNVDFWYDFKMSRYIIIGIFIVFITWNHLF